MSSKERWLSSSALLIAILPFVLVAGSIQLLPDFVILPNLLINEPGLTLPKYKYLITGLFGLVPVVLVIIARILRERKLVERNFLWMISAALVLGLVFLSSTAFGMIEYIVRNKVDLLQSFDFFGSSAVVVSLIGGMLANFLPQLRRNDILGLKNKYTMGDNRVWIKVHRVAADVYMVTLYAFAILSSVLSVWLDYHKGWIHVVLWVITVGGLIIWGRLYSRRQYNKINGEQAVTVQEA